MKNKIKKRSLRTFLFLLAATGCIGFAACAKEKVHYSFSANGGTIDVAEAEVKKGEEYSLPTPTREGYAFEGWYDTEDFSGEKVEKITDANESLTFYAKWAKLYTVTLDAAGGTLGGATSFTAKAGANLFDALQNYAPVKSGYEFGAWYDAEKNKKITKSDLMPESDVALTAQYKVGYKIEIYKENEDQTGYDRSEVTYFDYVGTEVVAHETFRGFRETTKAASADAEGTLARITLKENASENVMRLYFNRETYNVTYKAVYPDGSRTLKKVVSVLYGKSVRVPCDLAVEGYYLEGWSTKQNGETEYAADVINHTLYGEETAEETSAEIAPDRDMILYAQWNKGYKDMFGGGDYLFLFNRNDSEDIYLCRGNVYIKGTYEPSDSSFSFENRNGAEAISGKLVTEDTFTYFDTSKSVTAYLCNLVSADGSLGMDKSVYITFDDADGLKYFTTHEETDEKGETKTIAVESAGTFILDKDGLYKATFTTGELQGKTITFLRTKLTSSDGVTEVFVQKNTEQETSMYRHMVNGSMLILSSMYQEGYMQLTLNGFGIATLNLGTTASPNKQQFYYYMENGEIVLYDNSRSEQARLRVFDYHGKTGYMFYQKNLDRQIGGEGNTSIEMDGVCNIAYKNEKGIITEGIYSYSSSLMGGLIVNMANADEQYKFLVTSKTTEQPGDNGETTSVTTYSFVNKLAGYAEYYYQSQEGTKPGPLLAIDDEKAGTATIYEAVPVSSRSYVYEKAAVGTYTTYIPQDDDIYLPDMYLFTATEHFPVENGSGSYDVAHLKTAVFRLDTTSTSYQVYYWYSSTIGETTTDYTKTYKSADGDEGVTLTKIGGIMVLNQNGMVTSGAYTAGANGLGVIKTASGSGIYVKIYEEAKTFEIYWTANLKSAFMRFGKVDSSRYITYVGNGTIRKGDASYTLVTTEGETTTETVYTGTFEETDEAHPFATALKVCIFKGKNQANQEITVKFLRAVTANSELVNFLYEENDGGDYTSASEGTLSVDRFGAFARYIAPNGAYVYGTFEFSDDVENLLIFTDSDGYVYLFDLDKTEKTFTVRGGEYGTYRFFENRELSDYEAELDGYNHLKMYLLDSESDDRTLVDGNASYTRDGELFTLKWKPNPEQNVETEGVLRKLVAGNEQIAGFVVCNDEALAKTYINRKDLSTITLDRIGNAVRYAKNGEKETGSYMMITDELFYFLNSAGSDASLYRISGSTAEKCYYRETFSYYTAELDALLFTKYGIATINGATQFFEIVDDHIDLYERVEEDGNKDVNKYGYKITKNFLQLNDDRVPEKVITREGKEYYFHNGYDINFARNVEEAKANEYPVRFQVNSKFTTKAMIVSLSFAPAGTEEYTVSGKVKLSYKNEKEEDKTAYLNCNITRNKDGSMYLTLGAYRFDIEVNYKVTGENYEIVTSTYSIKNMRWVQEYSSYVAVYYKLLNSIMGLTNDYPDKGKIRLVVNYDKQGEPETKEVAGTDGETQKITVYRLTTLFTKDSGFVDYAGNLFELTDAECTAFSVGNATRYRVEFEGADRYRYRLYMQYQAISSVGGYRMWITREETYIDETNGYKVQLERVVVSEGGLRLDSYSSMQLFNTADVTEYDSDIIFRSEEGKPWMFVSRQYDDNGKITGTTYYEIAFKIKAGAPDADTSDKIEFYDGVIVQAKPAVAVYTEDGKSYVDICEDKVTLIALKNTLYFINESKYDAATGEYTVTATSGYKFRVKVTGEANKVAEITEIVEENA